MWNWILIASPDVLGMGVFARLGGLGAAGETFPRRGESVSHRERRLSPSS